MSRLRPYVWHIVVIGVALLAYALLRHKRAELVDFEVIRTAAFRALAAEPLYRPDDGHYQYKYLPTFAFSMAPFTWPPKEVAEATWFSLSVIMAWALVRLSLRALPDRRVGVKTLVWLTLLLNGKFLVKELAFGQFNLPLALLLIGAISAAQHRRAALAGCLVGVGVFVKPYALVLVPWLALALGWPALIGCGLAIAAGLLVPIVTYGWSGNLALLGEWYRTVTETTAPNLLTFENISLNTMWSRWIHPGTTASALAALTSLAAIGLGLLLLRGRRDVREPNFLEGVYFLVLIPILSPQGWDYVLLLALPAYMILVDRFAEFGQAWRIAILTGFFVTSFAIFDVMRRALYTDLMRLSAGSVGAIVLALALARLRWRRLA